MIRLDIYYTEFLTLFWFAMLVNQYGLEIQFKKVRNVRNIHNIPVVGSRPLECRSAQNAVCAERTLHGLSWHLIHHQSSPYHSRPLYTHVQNLLTFSPD